jgi:hypothetical protein
LVSDIPRLSLPSSVVDVIGVVFTRRAVDHPISDRVEKLVRSQMVHHVLPRIRREPLVI